MTNLRIADQLDLLTQAQEIDELQVGFTVHFEVLAPADLAELEELKNAIKAPYEITRFSIYPGSYTLQITLIADIPIPSAPYIEYERMIPQFLPDQKPPHLSNA